MAKSRIANSEYVGSSNEAGTLHSFLRKGFTPEQCILELVANSIDSFDNLNKVVHPVMKETVFFDVRPDDTLIIDNAEGMGSKDIEHYWDFNRENHSNDYSRGVSGVGGKVALIILSAKGLVKGWTVKEGDHGYSFTADFADMYKAGKYIGKVKREKMTESQMNEFHKIYAERNMLDENNKAHGTVLFLPTNDELRNVLKQNFESPSLCMIDPFCRINVVFGAENVEFVYKDFESGQTNLQMYDYFGGEQKDYYCGYDTYEIETWRDEKKKADRFIYTDSKGVKYEFPVVGNGFSKTVVEGDSVGNTSGQKKVSNILLNVGVRRDKKIFDEEKPSLMTASVIETDYNVSTIGYIGKTNSKSAGAVYNHTNDTFLMNTRLRRNNQIIGKIPTERSLNNSRADGESKFKFQIVQSELQVKTISKQKHEENHIDRICGTQENKNQHNSESLPKNLSRLIDFLQVKKASDIWSWMEETVKKYKEVEAKAQAVEAAKKRRTDQQPPVESKKKEEVKPIEPAKKEAVKPLEPTKKEDAKPLEPAKKEDTKPLEPAKEALKAAEPEKKEIKTQVVPQHVKGAIKGEQLRVGLIQFLNGFDASKVYQGDYVTFYNLMNKLSSNPIE